MRVHTPFSEQFRRLASDNRKVFVAHLGAGNLFWRYFHKRDLRTVVNLLQEAFGSKMAVLREPGAPSLGDTIRIVDTWTGKVKVFPKRTGEALLRNQPQKRPKTHMRYHKV